MGEDKKKIVTMGLWNVRPLMAEELANNSGVAASTGSTQLVHRTPKMQMETLKKLQGQIVAIKTLLYLSPALLLMAMERKIGQVQTRRRRHPPILPLQSLSMTRLGTKMTFPPSFQLTGSSQRRTGMSPIPLMCTVVSDLTRRSIIFLALTTS
jgi:hypothetical protein